MKKSLAIGIAVGALALLGGTVAVKYMGTHGVHSIENIADGTNHASHKGATGTESVDPHANHGTEGGEKCSMMTPEMKAKMEAKGKMKDGKCSMMEMKGMMANLTPEQKLEMENMQKMMPVPAKTN